MNWNGWYRLLNQGNNIRMPELCVSQGMCSTDVPLWLNGSHPRLEDGVVTRKVCGSWNNDCCYFKSFPIQVKACPGNYYVYEFVSPAICSSVYCADIDSITPVDDPEIPEFIDPMTTTTTTVMMDPCTEQNCTEDEWCGERDGIYGCFCNESHSRTGDESYDSRETCESSSGTMSLSRCQLFEAGFPVNVLHLSDPSCNGTLQNGRLVFHFDNDDHICGTNLTANGTHFVYENSIQGVADSAGGPINRKKQLELRFSCIYQLSQTLTMDMEFNPLQSIVHKTLPDGQGMYQVRMIPYQDAAFSHPYDGSEDIVVDQRIYVEVIVKGVDSRQISTVIDSCWATPVNDQNFAVRWDLIINKCPNQDDKTVKVLQNGVSTTGRFSFKMLAFNNYYSKVFLHCAIHLCLLQGNNCAANCSPGQQHRAGRSVDIHDKASISVGPFIWTAGSTGE
ncbi:pancreatic secretory granule membrane major glycoprotein GP2-like [Colossoma macropomum]|uniref:pancreatic secretory granule membrane major glycoprotein GP2-like n=1 Tax=Colossoma macropomum TaxID=42526 RepID=UPI001864F49B|nr:pancreatic secretory granule membrane major glycoprotein GP2-like [Colossoma macropomum]